MVDEIKAGPFTIPIAADCHLCWLIERIETGGGPLEIGLCYALHTGAAAAGGVSVPICDRHQSMVNVTALHFMEALHGVTHENAPPTTEGVGE